MRKLALVVISVLIPIQAFAEINIPETVTTINKISDGPYVFALEEIFNKTGQVEIFTAADLKYQGQLPSGFGTSTASTKNGRTVYVVSSYYSRGVRGTRQDVVEVYDVPTLNLKTEIVIPSKHSQGMAEANLTQFSADERFLLIQNATPATSVTVIDAKSQKFAGEIPSPGCWGIYPSVTNPRRYSALCGDGSMASFTLSSAGATATRMASQPFFDVDADALFVHGERKGDLLYFVSFNGNIYVVDISKEKPVLVDKFATTTGVDGNWRPGGEQIAALDRTNGILHVLMHKDGKEGSHHNVGTEIWAIDLAAKKVVSRSPIKPAHVLAGGEAQANALYIVHPITKEIERLTVDPATGFKVTPDKTVPARFTSQLDIRP